MKERPILFNGAMVRAIIEGRKTQTRRPVKDAIGMADAPKRFDAYEYEVNHDSCKVTKAFGFENEDGQWKSPFGDPGDVLWVRETFYDHGPELGVECRATEWDRLDSDAGIWRPSIHMPKWACRLKLKVKRVWVERVQDISVSDCIKEGTPCGCIKPEYCPGARLEFLKLWDSIYGTWAENPWVWCCEFEV